MTKKLLMGNEAFAYAALESGVRVVAGYPGTPSTELVETVAKLHAQGKAQGLHVEWSTNEKAALELLAGASYCGARTLYTCKQVGLNVASDPLMSLNYVGVKGGCVLFVADDPGPISSQTEQDTRRFASFAKLPVLDPATPEQGFAMMKYAFDLSEQYKTPVIVRPTTRINHASTYFDVQDSTLARPVPEEGFQKDPKWIIFPRRSYAAHKEIIDRLEAYAADLGKDSTLAWLNPVYVPCAEKAGAPILNRSFGEEQGKAACSMGASPKPEFGIVAGGISASYALDALAMLAKRAQAAGLQLPSYSFVQVGVPYPFPADRVTAAVGECTQVLALEELDHVLEDELLKMAGARHLPYQVHGKLDKLARNRGENDIDSIASVLAHFFGMDSLCSQGQGQEDGCFETPLPVRPPVLCAGCPHRGSFYAVKRAVGKREAVYCGDIGCYTLGNAAPLYTTDTCLCMGAGITMAQGFAVAQPDKKQIAFVGDSTFFASGLTGCVNAVYNGHDVTVVVLDNATTAMTGSQPHPGTGVTLMGPHRKPVDIKAMLLAIGFECITEADPLNLEESMAAAQEAIDFEGPSGVIFRSPCVQLKKPDPAVSIDAAKCTACKKCITEIGCPGIGFDTRLNGEKSRGRGMAFIDAGQCNGCGLCVQICPFKAISPSEKEA